MNASMASGGTSYLDCAAILLQDQHLSGMLKRVFSEHCPCVMLTMELAAAGVRNHEK